MPTLEPYRGNYYLWKYLPSFEAAAISAALFGIATIAHTVRLSKNRSWFAIPFPIGGISTFLESIIAVKSLTTESQWRLSDLLPEALQETRQAN